MKIAFHPDYKKQLYKNNLKSKIKYNTWPTEKGMVQTTMEINVMEISNITGLMGLFTLF